VPTCSRLTMSGRGGGNRRFAAEIQVRRTGERTRRSAIWGWVVTGVAGAPHVMCYMSREGEAEQRRPRPVVFGGNIPILVWVVDEPTHPNCIENDPISPPSNHPTKHIVQWRHCHFPTRCRENNQPHTFPAEATTLHRPCGR